MGHSPKHSHREYTAMLEIIAKERAYWRAATAGKGGRAWRKALERVAPELVATITKFEVSRLRGCCHYLRETMLRNRPLALHEYIELGTQKLYAMWRLYEVNEAPESRAAILDPSVWYDVPVREVDDMIADHKAGSLHRRLAGLERKGILLRR